MIMIMTMTNADACSSHFISFHITVSKKQDEYIAPLDGDSELILFNNRCESPFRGCGNLNRLALAPGKFIFGYIRRFVTAILSHRLACPSREQDGGGQS